MIAILGVIILCAIDAILYRAGGMSKDITANPKWMPMWLRKSWCRDWLCPLFLLLALFSFWRPSSLWGWVMLLLYYILSGGALSLYWDDSKNKFLDKICKIINWKYPADNYFLYGLGAGLAGFCLITFVPWWVLTLRLIICTVGMGLWSKWQSNDVAEEFGRGVFFIL